MLTARITIAALLLLVSTLGSPLAYSQENLAKINQKDEYPIIRAPNWLNQQFLIKQRKSIEEVTRSNFGQSLKIGKGNIPILQRIINEELIPIENKLKLQALGIVLGDIIVEYDRKLAWQVYEDAEGSSHAVCLLDTKHCLFPATMLSRRIEAGATVDVRRIYEKVLGLIEPVLPKRAYSNR